MSNKDFNIVEGVLIKYTGADKNVVIPDGVLVIDKFAFSKDITSVVIPNSVLAINKYAFNQCECLTNIDIPDSVTSICESAFGECTGLTSVKFGKGIKKIDKFAFYKCTNLKEVTIESGKIKEYAFKKCTGLKTIKIGADVKSVSAAAFSDCSIDKAVIESKSVGNLNAEIKTLVLKKSVKKFDMVNFMKCKEVYCEAKKKPFGWKWSYTKKYHETMMRGGYYATVHWGVDISKV